MVRDAPVRVSVIVTDAPETGEPSDEETSPLTPEVICCACATVVSTVGERAVNMAKEATLALSRLVLFMIKSPIDLLAERRPYLILQLQY